MYNKNNEKKTNVIAFSCLCYVWDATKLFLETGIGVYGAFETSSDTRRKE